MFSIHARRKGLAVSFASLWIFGVTIFSGPSAASAEPSIESRKPNLRAEYTTAANLAQPDQLGDQNMLEVRSTASSPATSAAVNTCRHEYFWNVDPTYEPLFGLLQRVETYVSLHVNCDYAIAAVGTSTSVYFDNSFKAGDSASCSNCASMFAAKNYTCDDDFACSGVYKGRWMSTLTSKYGWNEPLPSQCSYTSSNKLTIRCIVWSKETNVAPVRP